MTRTCCSSRRNLSRRLSRPRQRQSRSRKRSRRAIHEEPHPCPLSESEGGTNKKGLRKKVAETPAKWLSGRCEKNTKPFWRRRNHTSTRSCVAKSAAGAKKITR